MLLEFAVTDHLPQVSIARRDDTNIDPRGTGAAHSLELALLEHSKKLGLKLQRHVSNFVEEQRSTIGQRKTAHVRTNSAGESSALVSEEFAFQKTGGHRRAVHLDEVPAASRTELMNRSGDHFFAGSRLAGDQDSDIRGRHRLNFREDRAHAATAPHDCLQEGGFCAFRPAQNRFGGGIDSRAPRCSSPVFVTLCIRKSDHVSFQYLTPMMAMTFSPSIQAPYAACP